MGFEYWDFGKKWRYQDTSVEGNWTLKLSKNNKILIKNIKNSWLNLK